MKKNNRKNRNLSTIVAASLLISSVFQGVFPMQALAAQDGSALCAIRLSDPETAVYSSAVPAEDPAAGSATQSTAKASAASDILDSLVPGKDYVEGSVILIVKESSPDRRLGGKNALLAEAEELADVTDVVEDDPGLVSEAAGEEVRLGAADRVVISVVKSEKYTTAQLLDMYESIPGVIEVQPDFIVQLSEAEYEDPETDCAEEVFIDGAEDSSLIQLTDNELSEDGLSEETDHILENVSDKEEISGTDEEYDRTDRQYFAGSSKGGMDVPGWNDPSNKNAEGTVVAVLDTGVDYTHPDLCDVMWDEGEDYPSLVEMGGGKYGLNACNKRSDGTAYDTKEPIDENGHGTHCAGIIAADWDGKGVSGIVNGTKIMGVKVGDDKGILLVSYILKGFEYVAVAKQAGVDLVAVNVSLGSLIPDIYELLMFKKLEQAGVVVVQSSGNSYQDNDLNEHSTGYYFNYPGVIVVNSSDAKGKKAVYSNYGIRSTDVFAPGDQILSSCLADDGTYAASHFKEDSVLMDDSFTPAFDDMEAERVFFDPQLPEDSTLSLSVVKMTSNIGKEDNHMLKVDVPATTGQENTNVMTLDLGDKFSVQKPRFLVYSGTAADSEDVRFGVKVPLKDGTSKRVTMLCEKGDWYSISAELPENTDYEHLELTITADESDVDRTAYLDDIGLTSSCIRYAYHDGTSMAAPCVTAAVAIAASNFETEFKADEKTTALRVARVIGSVSADEALASYCRSGGIVNVSRLLDEDYDPVIKAAGNDEETMTIDGYFFGDEKGDVSVDDEPCRILDWSDGRITVSMPFVPTKTEAKVEIRTGDQRYGMRYVGMKTCGGEYLDRFPLPMADKGFVEMLFATDDEIYFGVKKNLDEFTMWKYNIPGDKWMELSDFSNDYWGYSYSAYVPYSNYVFSSADGDISVYDRKQEKYIGSWNIIDLYDWYDIGMVNSGKNIFIFSAYEKDENGKTVKCETTNVYKLTPLNMKEGDMDLTKVGQLNTFMNIPRAVADNDGNMYVTDGRIVEKVVFDPIGVKTSATVLSDSLFEQSLTILDFDVAAVKDGIIFFGDMETGSGERVEHDVYLMKYDGTVSPYKKSFATSPVQNCNVIAYRNKVFFTALNRYGDPWFDAAVESFETNAANEDVSSGRKYNEVPDRPEGNVVDKKLEIDGNTYYLSASVSVYYTGQKHVLYDGKAKGSKDLKLDVKGYDPNKFMLKKVTIKNSKKATHTPSVNLIVAEKKRACMIPSLKAVKGVKLTAQEKSQLKALNAYFKANPVYFSILQRDLSNKSIGNVAPVYNKNGSKLTKLNYRPMGAPPFALSKKDYTVEYVDPSNIKAGFTVVAKEGGNLWGSCKL